MPRLPSQIAEQKVNNGNQEDIDALKSANERLYKLAVAQALAEF